MDKWKQVYLWLGEVVVLYLIVVAIIYLLAGLYWTFKLLF